MAHLISRRRTSRPRRSLVSLALLLGAGGLSPLGAAPPAPQVSLAQGTLAGSGAQGVEAFLGIPFAAPPVGAARWRPPAPAASWTGVRDATHTGASCWQPVDKRGFGPWTHEYVVQDSVSEDCLFLNVWRPAGAGVGAKLPVMVWIHGGGFASGSGSVPIYEGTNLAKNGIIVVTINYRVGVMGFLAHPEITREAGSAPAANFGLQDQIAALRWIKANIGAFGGDPAKVTIAGQSAGSMSVHALVASPLAKGLFRGAIAESGLPTGPTASRPLSVAENDGEAFAREHGAASLAALRALSPEQLAQGPGGGLRFAPVIDGKVLPAPVADLLARGQFNDVPMIVGQTADDGVSIGPREPASAKVYADWFHAMFGAMGDRMAALYPAHDEASWEAGMRDAHLDRGLASLWQWAEMRRAHGRAPVWAYLFSHIEPGPEAQRWRAFHSSEIPYVFNTLDASPERGFTAQDQAVARTMGGYWVSFVKTGNPNGAGAASARSGAPAWPQLDTQKPSMLEIGEGNKVRPLIAPARFQALRDFIAQGGVVSLF